MESTEHISAEQVIHPRPFAFKALACCAVSMLCLACLASVQWQRAEHSRLRTPFKNETAPVPLPVKVIDVPAAKSGPELSAADYALAEVDAIRMLVDSGDLIRAKQAADTLRPYTLSTNAAVRDTAVREFERVTREGRKVALAASQTSISSAKALAAAKKFSEAGALIQGALNDLPKDQEFGEENPEATLRALISDYANQRKQHQAAIFEGLEAALLKKAADAPGRLQQALASGDPEIQKAAKALQDKVADELDAAAGAARALERNAREEWGRFFKRFGGTLADGDFAGASELCENPPFDVILKGGVSDPNAVLRSCAQDVPLIQKIYDEALADARGVRKNVSFRLRKGGQASGTLVGVNGKLLRVDPGRNGAAKSAEIGVKVTDLTAEGVKSLLDSGFKKKASVRLTLAALEAYETPAEGEKIITAAYEKEGQALPIHWAERFRLERLLVKIKDAEARMAVLKKAIDAGNGDDVKAAFEEAKSVAAELREMGGISEATRKLLATAETVASSKQLSNATLQNGVSPDANFKGINADQISEYRDSQRRTDVGVGYGLRMGAAGGLQRVLIKFDGLETVVGNGRVRKAYLELYQVPSPKSEGASVGAFRIKKSWVADSGSWLGYDNIKGHDWTIPGASGAEDIEAREDFNIVLDKTTNVWRRFDVTKFVQDVLAGKAQNNGLLFKVVNGEPDYHVRFYPETDLDRAKEKALRPRLVLEMARDAE